MNYKLPLESEETTVGFIKRIFHVMKQTLVPENVRSSVRQIGLRYGIDTSPYVLLFEGHMLRQSPGFTSLWQIDYPLKKLEGRRRSTPFGWVDKTMRPEWSEPG
jgi:hypothetical protein